jgi:hypothetical protein
MGDLQRTLPGIFRAMRQGRQSGESMISSGKRCHVGGQRFAAALH